MRVCLISAPTANDFDNPDIAESEAVRVVAEHAPLGILSLAAILEERQIVPEIVDLNRIYYDCLKSEEYRNRPNGFLSYAARFFESLSFDVFGFSTICSSYPLTLRIAGEVKRAHPAATIVLGGPQSSVVDVATMRAFPFIDYVVRGEAEATFPKLLESLAGGRCCDDLGGLTYRRGAAIVRTPNAPVIEDLDALPLPAYHLYPYMHSCEYIALELGRGCPFACSFCSTNDFFRRRFRLKSPARVIDQMKQITRIYPNVKSFDLVHDMFTVDRRKVVEFCQAILGCGDEFVWGCSARTDCIDNGLIALMAKAGCRGIFFGIETGSARLQKVIHKGLDLADARVRIMCTNKHKIKTAVSLITGFPEETQADLKDTVDFYMDAARYDHADPQLCLLAPLAETPIETLHRGSLVFDDIISDMSFQGWQQDPADRELIDRYPEIFPNFYSVPTPHLDRQFLKELREFIMNGMERFRWLLVGLHQDSGGLLEVFSAWRVWRQEKKGDCPDGNPAIYYSSCAFPREFLRFVFDEYLARRCRARTAISALAQFEASLSAVDVDDHGRGDRQSPAASDDFGGLIDFDLIACVPRDVRVSRLNADFSNLVRCLRRKGRLERVPACEVTVVARTSDVRRTDLIQLSPLSADLLDLCDGRRTVRQIAQRFASSARAVEGVPTDATCMWGLELLRRQGLIVLLEAPHHSNDAGPLAPPLVFGAREASSHIALAE
jgi:radical SAM superfamily enzyme YgiQ (UPF0313 family)